MSGSRGEVEFELVDAEDASSSTASGGSSKRSKRVKEAQVRAFDEGNFPLAGPILEESGRVLKGRCSSCDRRLRVRVESSGPVRVRCPICGHARRIEA